MLRAAEFKVVKATGNHCYNFPQDIDMARNRNVTAPSPGQPLNGPWVLRISRLKIAKSKLSGNVLRTARRNIKESEE